MHTHVSQVTSKLGILPKDPGFGAITSSGGFIDMDTNHQSVCRLGWGSSFTESFRICGVSGQIWYHDRPSKYNIIYHNISISL